MDPPADIEWRISPEPVAYPAAVTEMETRAEAIRRGGARELIWLLEHPPLYTAGTSAVAGELLAPGRFPVHATGRGGRHTYHGPGQRVGYILLDLEKRGRDVRRYVHGIEAWVIAALGLLGVSARAIDGKVGIWTDRPDGRAAKIGAIGVRVRRWVTLHGFAINVSPDLDHFGGIVPCGLPDPVTSLADLGREADMAALDRAIAQTSGDFILSLS